MKKKKKKPDQIEIDTKCVTTYTIIILYLNQFEWKIANICFRIILHVEGSRNVRTRLSNIRCDDNIL